MKNIVLVGSGNVATHIGISLIQQGYKIKQVWSNKLKNAEILAKKLNSTATNKITSLEYADADLYIISVKDDILANIIQQLKNINIVHTSGSAGLEVFKNRFNNYGVLYPLQTFNKEVSIDLSTTPICIEANNQNFHNKLIDVAAKLSKKVVTMKSEQRQQLHIAAVFACNFTNHMFEIANNILNKSNIDFKLLLPIINQTVIKLEKNKPSEVQTGPAKRKDKEIIQKHIDNIQEEKLKDIYKLISNSIMKENE